MGRLKIRHKKKHALELSLNITSLMDVLTVLLFFLLKSFSVTSNTLETPNGIRLPASVAKASLEEAINLSYGKDGVRVDSTMVVPAQEGVWAVTAVDSDGRTLTALKKVLEEQYAKRNLELSKSVPTDEIPPGRILIQADREIPFSQVKHVLHTAALAGYSDFRFVVTNPED
jgi:biopolymer transport protein ExbD